MNERQAPPAPVPQSPTETAAAAEAAVSQTQPLQRKKPYIYTVLKIAEAEHAASFRNGTMYMNTLRFFKELKNAEGELIGDPLEGVAFIGQPSKLGRLEIGGHVVDPSELAGPVLFDHDDILDLKVFCMYAVHSGEYESVSDENMREFEEYLKIQADKLGLGNNKKLVLITDTPAFMARVRAALQREQIYAEGRLMTYFDMSEFHGPVDRPGFYKAHDFSAQREWRFVARVPNDGTRRLEPSGAYKLEIGSIEDISILTTVGEFNSTIKFGLPDDVEDEGG